MIGRLLLLARGQVRVRVTGASLPRFLNVCARNQLTLHNMKRVAWNELQASLSIADFRELRRYMGRTGCRVHIIQRKGLPFTAALLRPRFALWGGFFALIFLCWALCTHIWSIQTHFDDSLPRDEIMRQLEQMGVRIGAPCRSLNVRKLRWRMMQLQPDITFFALNLQGNSLTIEARGKTRPAEMLDKDAIVKVVATRDGVIRTMRVQEGFPLVKSGDAVRVGDTLISGMVPPTTENGSYRLTHARGTAEAYTAYHIETARSLIVDKKRYTGKVRRQYALVLGKKRLNLYFGSGITGATCDKIVEKKTAWLSDSVIFPISLIVQTYAFYEREPTTKTIDDVRISMLTRALGRLATGLDGMVTAHTEQLTEQNGAAILSLHVDASEQIGEEALDDSQLPEPSAPEPIPEGEQ